MSEELKTRLKEVSEELANISKTREIVDKMLQGDESGQTVQLVNAKSEDKEQPDVLTVHNEVVAAVMRPIVNITTQRRERMLAIKEQILTALEQEALGEGSAEEVEAPASEE